MSEITNNEFNMNPNTTNGLSAEMKTYYSDYLIDNAVPNLVHDQFGQKHPIPANGGKTINFRKFVPFNKASKPLTEGVTPDGGSLSVTNVTAEVSQYGYYVTLSDVLMLTAVDNTLVETTRLLGNQAGSTLDTVSREVLNSGTSVMYSGGKDARCMLEETSKLKVDDVFRAARFLKSQNAPRIDGGYVAIVHPDVSYDLMRDEEWTDVNKYAGSANIFNGEIGKIGGVRFVESTEAKIFHANDLTAASRTLTTSSFSKNASDSSAEHGSVSPYKLVVKETFTDEDAKNLVGRKIHIIYDDALNNEWGLLPLTISGASASTSALYFLESSVPATFPFSVLADYIVYPGEAGAKGRDVYSTLVLGANAYGVTEVTGGGLEHIVKQLGSGGTADPLNQRATAGWKGTKVCELLVDNYMTRIESVSSFESGEN